jgi:hypothetical protein
MESLITGNSYKQYLKLIGTHIKAYHTNVSYPNEDGSESTEGLPSLQALYGIYDSLLTAHKALCGYFGDISNPTASTACTSIPRGFTIAIDNNNSIVEYQYKKVRPNNGYTMYDLEVKTSTGGGPTPSDISADDVSYNPSSTYTDGTIGDAMKEAESDIQSNSTSISDIISSIGNLSSLHTEHKGSLVGAINEIADNEESSITVVDDLNSTSSNDALSANQGRVLKGLVDSKVSGIQVTGESNPRYPVNGIVTIPAEGGSGDITGATVGGAQVPEVGGILQFQAYPTVPIKSIQVDGAQNPLNPDGNGKVTIPAQPNVPITGINDANGNALTPVQGIVTLPQAAAAPTADTMAYNNSTTYSNGSIGKALHDTITALGYEYSTSSTIATNPSHNMYYNLTGSAISSLDVSDISPTNDKEIIILFLTNSSSGCSIILAETPTPQRIIGSASLAKGQVYIMSILRGVVCLVEAPAFVAPVTVLSSESE